MNSLVIYGGKTYTCLDSMLGFFLTRFGRDRESLTRLTGSKIFTRLDQGVVRFSALAEQSLELRRDAHVRMGDK